MGVTYNPKIATDGLVLCLDAANRRSYPGTGTTWSDLAGANDGTLTNMDASNFSTDNGGVLSFDGTNESISCGTGINLLSDLTFLIWVAPFSLSGTKSLISDGTTASMTHRLEFGRTTNRLGWVHSGSVVGTSTVNCFSSSNEWAYVGVTRVKNGSNYNVIFYKNGSSQSSFTTTTAPSTNVDNLSIGSRGDGTALHSDIKTGIVHIYNRALTADEIRQNYNATKGRYS
jgi:hypothetical protein